MQKSIFSLDVKMLVINSIESSSQIEYEENTGLSPGFFAFYDIIVNLKRRYSRTMVFLVN